MARYTYMFLLNPKAGREKEWDEWHRTHHVPDVLDIPGFVSCRRFRAASAQRDNSVPQWQNMALYEVETDDPVSVFAEIKRRVGTGQIVMSDTADPSRAVAVLWEPISEHAGGQARRAR